MSDPLSKHDRTQVAEGPRMTNPPDPAGRARRRRLRATDTRVRASDCTTAPHNGPISGCYPLDPCYERLPEAAELKALKRALRP
ncbi:MAG: hypothetical protein E2O39_07320 [Planctomycetota bacterium]|nr:MAG: hypothetical protein E2O39_07320 [Planctomycetota bacterium]